MPPSCRIELKYSEVDPDALLFIIRGCPEMKSLIATFEKGETKFFGGETFGIQSKDETHFVVVHDNGSIEYSSPKTEVNCNIPPELAGQFLAYVEKRVGQDVTEPIIFTAAQDPQNVGGKRRKTIRRKRKH
jgi:hypothetical protein